MAGIADLKDAFPAFYNENFWVVSATDWEIPAFALDATGANVAWTNCTAIAKFRRGNGNVAKTATNVLAGGLQIDLSTAGKIILRGTPTLVFADSDLNKPLRFNIQITCTSPALVLTPFQNCFLIPQANLNS